MSSALPQLDRTVHETHLFNPIEQNPTDRIIVTLDPEYPIEGFNGSEMAIDGSYTSRPEDALSGIQNQTSGRPAARRTLVDPSTRDGQYDSVCRIFAAMGSGDFDGVYALLNIMERPHYKKESHVRSVVTPFCRSRNGNIVSPGPRLENVRTDQYYAGSRRLHDEDRYIIAEKIAHKIAQLEYPDDTTNLTNNHKERKKRGLRTVRIFAMTTNIILTEWALQHGIPQIVKSRPEEITVDTRTAVMSKYVVSSELDPEELGRYPASHTGVGKRDQRIAGWVNQTQIATMLRNGEPAFDTDTIRAFTDGLTSLKVHRRS